jgi:hypothetical protein
VLKRGKIEDAGKTPKTCHDFPKRDTILPDQKNMLSTLGQNVSRLQKRDTISSAVFKNVSRFT